jgi:hypothetical protein
MKTLLLILLLVPMKSFGQEYRLNVNEHVPIDGFIGWNEKGDAFATRTIGSDDGIGAFEYVEIISLKNNVIDEIYSEGEFLDKKQINAFLFKHRIIQEANPKTLSVEDIKKYNLNCLDSFLVSINEGRLYRSCEIIRLDDIIDIYKSPLNNSFLIEYYDICEENGGGGFDDETGEEIIYYVELTKTYLCNNN